MTVIEELGKATEQMKIAESALQAEQAEHAKAKEQIIALEASVAKADAEKAEMVKAHEEAIAKVNADKAESDNKVKALEESYTIAKRALANPAFADAGNKGGESVAEGGAEASTVKTQEDWRNEFRAITDPGVRAKFLDAHRIELGLK